MARRTVRLPPLDAVRGFVAVARRMSITLAAEDLHLTQSAVSRKIRTLEDILECKLLERGHRSIRLTPTGQRLFRVADASIGELEEVFADLAQSNTRNGVTITASIGVAGLWLLPRLGALKEDLPGVDVRVLAENRMVDLRKDGVDLAVRYCAEKDGPPGATRLFGETTIPVAHPDISVEKLDENTLPELVLLEFDDPGRPWLQWSEQLSSAGLGSVGPKGIVRFNQYDQVIHASVAGQGIALGRRALVEPMLADGRLREVPWAGPGKTTDHAYWLVQAEGSPRPDVMSVRDWVLREAAKSDD